MASGEPRVLLLTGGADLPEAHLIAGVARALPDVHLVCEPDSPNIAMWKEAGLGPILFRCKDKFDPTAIIKFRNMMKQNRYDLFHAFTGRTLTNAMLACIGLPLAPITYCGTTDHLHAMDPAARIGILSKRIWRVSCVSSAVRSYLQQKGLKEEALVTIHKGHDPAWYTAYPRAHLLEMGIPDDAVVAVCVANMRPVKGVDVLVRAAEHIATPNLHLLLIGETRDKRIPKMAAASPLKERIHLVGPRSDAASLIGACDITVVPSTRSEGMPKTVLEAMCQKVPVVATRVGGIPELMDNGKTGILVPPNDPQSLATAIDQMASDDTLRQRMGQAGGEKVLNDFSHRTTIEKTLEMYRSVLTKEP